MDEKTRKVKIQTALESLEMIVKHANDGEADPAYIDTRTRLQMIKQVASTAIKSLSFLLEN